MDVEKVKFALLVFPDPMRSWIAPLLPQRRRISRNHRNLKRSDEEYTVLNFLLQTAKDNDPDTLSAKTDPFDCFRSGFNRKVMSTVQLSDGTVIHPGETIAMPSEPMSQDTEYYDDALRFNGDRFYQAMTKGPDESRSLNYKYTEIEPGNLSWGNGRFSCPGRWYASLMMKLLLATLILGYDFEFPPDQTWRPSNVVVDVHVLPDMKRQILIKRRAGKEDSVTKER
ncbi:MAG: hypothetical protein Q9211_001705 [Gyalolechia sp. 1 TL-2023]